MRPRIDKAYYRLGPQLRLWRPFNRERRLWRAGAIHAREYQRQLEIRALLSLFEMEVGETRNGVTLIARAP
jgi:hypothetical protein